MTKVEEVNVTVTAAVPQKEILNAFTQIESIVGGCLKDKREPSDAEAEVLCNLSFAVLKSTVLNIAHIANNLGNAPGENNEE